MKKLNLLRYNLKGVRTIIREGKPSGYVIYTNKPYPFYERITCFSSSLIELYKAVRRNRQYEIQDIVSVDTGEVLFQFR